MAWMIPKSRRFVWAASAAAAVLLVQVAIGAVQAEPEMEPSSMRTVRLPSPHLGDVVGYAVDDRWGVVLDWIPATGHSQRFPTGHEASGDILQARSTTNGALVAEAMFDGGTGQLLRSSSRASLGVTFGFIVSAGGLTQQGYAIDGEWITYAGADGEACGFDGAFAGIRLTPASTLRVGPCRGPLMSTDAPLQLSYNGTGQVLGQEGMWFEGREGDTVLRLLLGGGVPYPLAMRLERSWPGQGVVTRDYVLVGFTRGTEPRGGATALAPVAGMPEPRLSRGGALPIDEAGLAFPFPLSSAVDAARPLLAAYGHADAPLFTASLSTGTLRGAVHRTWFLAFGDSDWQFDAHIVQAAEGAPRAIVRTWSETKEPAWDVRPAPQDVPSAAVLVATYEWLTGQDADCFGFSFAQHNAPHQAYWAGQCRVTTSEQVQPPDVGYRDDYLQDRLRFDESGRVSSWEHVTGEHEAGSSITAPVGMDEAPSKDASTPLHMAALFPAGGLAVGGSVALGVGLLAYFWPVLRSLPVLGLFSRLREDELASHPMRRRILDAIAARPGIHLKELGRVTGTPNGSLVHHTRRLAEAGLVAVRKGNGYTCYFLTHVHAESHRAASAIKSEGARKVLSAIAHRPRLSALDVERQTGLSPATVHHHLKRLTDAGLVRQQRNGRSLSLEATWAAKAALVA